MRKKERERETEKEGKKVEGKKRGWTPARLSGRFSGLNGRSPKSRIVYKAGPRAWRTFCHRLMIETHEPTRMSPVEINLRVVSLFLVDSSEHHLAKTFLPFPAAEV